MTQQPMSAHLDGLLFLGSVLPRKVCQENPDCSVAANNFQAELLGALSKRINGNMIVLSLRSIAAFPRSTCLFSRGSFFHLDERCFVHVVPFCNMIPFKPFSQFGSLVVSLLGLGEWRPSAILLYNPYLRYSLLALVLGKLWQVPVVAIVADAEPPEPWSLASFLSQSRWGMRIRLLLYFSGLIVLSKNVAADFCRGSPVLKMEGGISAEQVVYANHQNVASSSSFILMYSGDLAAYCGVQLLLDAFALLDVEKCELWITGRGPLQKAVEEAAKQDSRIRYFGFVSRENYLDLMMRATVLVNPRLSSYPENRYNFPSKLLEYLASGRPVITTGTSDLEEEYGDKCFLLREETPQALAQLIEQIFGLDSAELEAVGARARAYMLAHKTWRAQSWRVYDFLATLAQPRGQQP